MKKFLIMVTVIATLSAVLIISVSAAEVYNITVKEVLWTFDDVSDVTEANFGGSDGWGTHWIDTTLSEAAGLKGSKALQLTFSSKNDGDTLGGLHSECIGVDGSGSDWTAGDALMFRIKNVSSKSVNMAPTLDMLSDSSTGRVRYSPIGTQKLVNLDFTPADTVYTEALSKDGTTYSQGKNTYVVVPAGFDGYMLWNFHESEMLESQFEGIMEEGFEPDFAKVRYLVILFQDCFDASVIIDEFELVDYKLEAMIEAVEDDATAAAELPPTADNAAAAQPATAPATGDGNAILYIMVLFAAISFGVVIKKRHGSKIV